MWLRERRIELNLTLEQLSARLATAGKSYTASAIGHWEKGRYNVPLHDPEVRSALAFALGWDVQTLLIAAGYGQDVSTRTARAARAAAIMDQLSDDQQSLALAVLEQILARP